MQKSTKSSRKTVEVSGSAWKITEKVIFSDWIVVSYNLILFLKIDINSVNIENKDIQRYFYSRWSSKQLKIFQIIKYENKYTIPGFPLQCVMGMNSKPNKSVYFCVKR